MEFNESGTDLWVRTQAEVEATTLQTAEGFHRSKREELLQENAAATLAELKTSARYWQRPFELLRAVLHAPASSILMEKSFFLAVVSG